MMPRGVKTTVVVGADARQEPHARKRAAMSSVNHPMERVGLSAARTWSCMMASARAALHFLRGTPRAFATPRSSCIFISDSDRPSLAA